MVRHSCPECEGEPGAIAEAPVLGPTVAELEPGQEAEIYGGVHVTVISVEPVASEPDFPWVKLTYRCEYDEGSIVGTWVLPASQRLPLVQA